MGLAARLGRRRRRADPWHDRPVETPERPAPRAAELPLDPGLWHPVGLERRWHRAIGELGRPAAMPAACGIFIHGDRDAYRSVERPSELRERLCPDCLAATDTPPGTLAPAGAARSDELRIESLGDGRAEVTLPSRRSGALVLEGAVVLALDEYALALDEAAAASLVGAGGSGWAVWGRPADESDSPLRPIDSDALTLDGRLRRPGWRDLVLLVEQPAWRERFKRSYAERDLPDELAEPVFAALTERIAADGARALASIRSAVRDGRPLGNAEWRGLIETMHWAEEREGDLERARALCALVERLAALAPPLVREVRDAYDDHGW